MAIDAETLAHVLLGEGGLREQYPDDEDFLAAVEELKKQAGDEDGEEADHE